VTHFLRPSLPGPRAILVACTLVVVTAPRADALTALRAWFAEIATESALVFEGEVLAHRAYEDAGGLIYTAVTFAVLDVVAGEARGDTVTLEYLGGVAGGRFLEASGVAPPPVGERGIYFAADPSRRTIHPLRGLEEGRYLVADDAGAIRTARGLPVYGIDAAAALDERVPSFGVAYGVRTRPSVPFAVPMSPESFKAAVRAVREGR